MPGTSLRTNYFVQHKERTLTVPQVSGFRGIFIAMYYADPERHPVPHFYVRFAEYEASVMIEPPIWLAGLIPRR